MNAIIQHTSTPRCSCLLSHSTEVELMSMESSFGIRYLISFNMETVTLHVLGEYVEYVCCLFYMHIMPIVHI